MTTNFSDRFLEENRRLNKLARRLDAPILQPVDPDGPAIPCGCNGCGRDAVQVARFKVGTRGEYGLAGCGKHLDALAIAVTREGMAS
jgi:hypothetical protein